MADTLLEGKCSAVEEAWRVRSSLRAAPNTTAAKAASWATLVGYEQFLNAATNAVEVLARARFFAAECSDAQFLSFAQHVVHAAELV